LKPTPLPSFLSQASSPTPNTDTYNFLVPIVTTGTSHPSLRFNSFFFFFLLIKKELLVPLAPLELLEPLEQLEQLRPLERLARLELPELLAQQQPLALLDQQLLEPLEKSPARCAKILVTFALVWTVLVCASTADAIPTCAA
jgi:hypothetical protein